LERSGSSFLLRRSSGELHSQIFTEICVGFEMLVKRNRAVEQRSSGVELES
jgi:hypothetical protein